MKSEKKETTPIFDIGIIGCGIVGITTARELKLRYPYLKMICIDKEKEVGNGQTGHNSNIIHAGIYYKPGSLKAKLSVEGGQLMYDYCKKNKIPFRQNGKIIVATRPEQIPQLRKLYENATINKVKGVAWLDSSEAIKKVEPNCSGLKAIYSPFTGMLEFKTVAQTVGKEFQKLGGQILLNSEVTDISLKDRNNVQIHLKDQNIQPINVKFLITCAGLFSDRIAVLTGAPKNPVVVPFRGEYLKLKKEKNYLVKGNIYPVPDSRCPFLGVHFSPQMNGEVWLGPNAVPGTAREGYSYANVNLRDLYEILTFKGFYRLAIKYFTFGVKEIIYSIFSRLQVNTLREFIPNFTNKDVLPGPRGVRAQAMNEQGGLVEDFVFDFGGKEGKGRVLNVRNAPSPAATSSFSIAKYIANQVEREYKLKK